jgi:hypothetical protein
MVSIRKFNQNNTLNHFGIVTNLSYTSCHGWQRQAHDLDGATSRGKPPEVQGPYGG